MVAFGKIPNEPIREYHANDCVSKTRLDVFRRNPELFRKIFVTRELTRPEPTEAMVIGNAAGALILEGERAFSERYAVLPEGAPKRPSIRQREAKKPSSDTVDAIAWWDDFEANTAGKEVLSREHHALTQCLRDAIRRNETFAELTAQGEPEVSFRIKGRNFNVQVRPDWWNENGCGLTDGYPYIVDVKTIAELPQDDPDHLAKHIANFGYHRSAYLYPEVTANALKWKSDLPRPRFFLAFVEKDEPYDSEVVEVPELSVEIGQREVADALTRLGRCIETNVWRQKATSVRQVSLPNYYIKRAIETTEAHVA